ncbi:hypothetical protein DL98DRAFT_540777 [Cadophora sp. DSE1049]|nr:hypothetical protein DL98DRAFT_540777 [Cadophora sp. DSE1049]
MSDLTSPSIEDLPADDNELPVAISVPPSDPAPIIHPVLSTNEPSPRLKSLMTQLSKLDLHHGTPILKKFTLFPKLPLELRLKIWGFAANVERIVSLSFTLDGQAWVDVSRLTIRNENRAQCSVPAVLHICSESRKEGLRYYTACWDKCAGHNNYINLNTDILCVVENWAKAVIRQFNSAQLALPAANLTQPTAPLLLSERWNLDESVLRHVQTVIMLATAGWTSMSAPNLRRLADLFQLLPGMTTLRVVARDKVFDEEHVDKYYKTDEGYLWRALILTEHKMELKEEIERRIVDIPGLPACLGASTLNCRIMAVAGDKRWNSRLPLLLQEDLVPVGSINGEYKKKLCHVQSKC